MAKETSKKNGLFNALLAFLKPWLAFTGLYATFSVCPFCGQSSCPTGIAGAGIVGGVIALLVQRWHLLTGRRKRRKLRYTSDKERGITNDMEPMKYRTNEIEAGYHPLGFKIDNRTDPLNRYTQWTINKDGNWINSKPVCFHSLPTD